MTTTESADRNVEANVGKVLDRRSMLSAAAVMTAGVVASLSAPSAAMAHTTDILRVGVQNSPDTTVPAVWVSASGNDCIRAESTASGYSGLWGINNSGIGVTGDGSIRGLHGRSVLGDGVKGETGALNKSGVYAVHNGTGGYAVLARSAASTALRVEGSASFTRSGIATIPKNKASISILVPGVPLTGTSKFVVTLQKPAGSGVYVQYAIKSGASTFKVYLNKKSSKSSAVAWMVLD
jgi:hypothetical protein